MQKMQTSHDPRFAKLQPDLVLAAGPTGLESFAHDPIILKFLQDCYADAVRNTLYVALATAAGAVPFALGMQWLNVKKLGKDGVRNGAANSGSGTGEVSETVEKNA